MMMFVSSRIRLVIYLQLSESSAGPCLSPSSRSLSCPNTSVSRKRWESIISGGPDVGYSSPIELDYIDPNGRRKISLLAMIVDICNDFMRGPALNLGDIVERFPHYGLQSNTCPSVANENAAWDQRPATGLT